MSGVTTTINWFESLSHRTRLILGASVLSILFVVFSIALFSGTTHAQGGVGPGGSGSGGGGGHNSAYGYGWAIYPTASDGPRDGFRDGTVWRGPHPVTGGPGVQDICAAAGANEVFVFIVYDSDRSARGYNYLNWWREFTPGSQQDRPAGWGTGRAVGVDSSVARANFNNLPSFGVSTAGYTFGSNVAWFCWDFNPDRGRCFVEPVAVVAPGQRFTVEVGARNLGTNTWNTTGSPRYRVALPPGQPDIWGRRVIDIVPDLGGNRLRPNERGTATSTLTAPSSPGVYRTTWQLRNGLNGYFGDVCFRDITVRATPPPVLWDYDVTTSPSPSCQTRSPGQTFSVNSVVYNDGAGRGPNYRHRIYGWRGSDQTNIANHLTVTAATGGGSAYAGGRSWSNRASLPATGADRVTRAVTYRVDTTAPDGMVIQFIADVSPGSGIVGGANTDGYDSSRDSENLSYTTCVRVDREIYNYVPQQPRTRSQQALYYAGSRFDASAETRNIGETSGPTYTQTIEFRQAQITGDPFSGVRPALQRAGVPGNRSTLNTEPLTNPPPFVIAANTPHNTPIECRGVSSRDSGLGPPSPITELGSPPVASSWQTCFNVENRQFSIPDLDTSDVTFVPGGTALPTASFVADVRVCNDGPVPAGAQESISRRTEIQLSPGLNSDGAVVTSTVDIPYGGGGCVTRQFNGTVEATAQLGDLACIDVRINRQRGFSERAPNGYNVTGTFQSAPTQFCIDVAEQAYFTVTEGGVWSGGDFDPNLEGYGSDWCAPTGFGRIETARLGTTGAVADYVAGAVNAIANFGSSRINTGTVTSRGLTFANASTEGNFGLGRCITNLSTYLSRDTALTNVRSLASTSAWPTGNGQWVRSTGNLSIGAHTINAGDRYTIIVDGNVTISGDIEFGNYSVSSKNDIPSLIIVATGRIDIAENVTRLDGIYFSLDVIDTCYNPGGNSAEGRLSDGVCDNQLNVTGSFVADDIEFRRTYGGVSGGNANGGNQPAEQFFHNAEMYLANHFLISDFTPSLRIDQQVDLPPVIN